MLIDLWQVTKYDRREEKMKYKGKESASSGRLPSDNLC